LFGVWSRYCRESEGDRERVGRRAVVRRNSYWICGVFPHMILNLTFSPTDNAQYFTVFKLGTRRCEKPILTGHYILKPQPPQPKSCTCFYADYISCYGRKYILHELHLGKP